MEENEVPKEENALSIVEEAKAIRDEIRKEREMLQNENDRKANMIAKDMLGGRSNMTPAPEPEKPETDEEFTARFEKGEIDLING